MTSTPTPWPAPPPAAPPPRRSAAGLALLAALLAVAALVVAIVAIVRPAQTSTPPYTTTQRASAKTHLCERYELAAEVEHIETNGTDPAFARISLTNGAVILAAAAADPALDTDYRDAALALAESYQTMAATSTKGPDDSQFKAALKAVASREDALKELCAA